MLLCTLNTLFDESQIGSFFRGQLKVGLNIIIHILIEKFEYDVIPMKKQLIYV